ncbi:MAG: hypothetical protein QOH26_1431, partial [Actinomycetota bacterium]|nr:hypothetical protein [Actinomycetota bacterium]
MNATSPTLNRAWVVTLVAGFAAIAVFFLIPNEDVQSGYYALFDLACGVLILVATRNIALGKTAWRCFGAALVLWGSGDFVYLLYSMGGAEAPYPSIADVFYLVGYLSAVGGVGNYVASRRRGSMLRCVMDAALISIPVALIAWELVVDHYVMSAGLSSSDLFGLSYPIMDLILFGAAFALILTPTPWPDTRLLGLAVAFLLLADVLYSTGLLAGTYHVGIWYDGAWLLSFVLWVAAAFHPSAKREVREQREREEGDSQSVLALVAAVLLIAVYVFVYLSGETISVLPAVLGGGGVMLLALGRMWIEVRRSRLNEERVKDLVDHASDAIFIVADHQYVDVNEAACTMTGYSRDELLAMELGSLNPLDQMDLFDELFAKLKAGGTVIAERDLVRKDGSRVTIESHARQLPDGRFQSIARDVSARIAAERIHREGEELLRHAFDTGASGMALGTLDGNFIKVNQAFASMLGYDPQDLAGTAIDAVTHPDDRHITTEPLVRMRSGALKEFHHEKRLLHRDGREI